MSTETKSWKSDRPYRMAVTVTLVFSDEAHREAWLEEQGAIPTLRALDVVDANTRDGQRMIAIRGDYERRKGGPDLIYTVGPIAKEHTR
jgi:hypothetical protein